MRHDAVVQKCASPLDHPTTPQILCLALVAHPAKLRRKNRERTKALTTFRMNTCKSVSKQRTLSPFRMNTCEKPGGGGHMECGGLAAAFEDKATPPNTAPNLRPSHPRRHRVAEGGACPPQPGPRGPRAFSP